MEWQEDQIWVMLATSQFRIFYFHLSHLNIGVMPRARHGGILRNIGTAPLLDLGTRLELVVSFMCDRFTSRLRALVPTEQGTGWAPQPV
jgi:hypothetical protein